jgi:anti-sigma factor RsiW
MIFNCCDKLDAYLMGDLPIGDVAHLESHLEACAKCREAIDEQKWVDSLLQSPLRIQIERPPATILVSLQSSLSHRRRRILQAAWGLAAAAGLLVAVGWSMLNRQVELPSISVIQNMAVTEAGRTVHPVRPQATFVATTDAIVVPLDSPSSDVTIVQVYPTTDTERRWRLEQSLLSASTKPNGG